MKSTILKLIGSVNLYIMAISYVMLKSTFFVSLIMNSPALEQLIFIKDLLLLLSVLLMRKYRLDMSIILGSIGLSLYGVFIIFNYSFFDFEYVRFFTYEEGYIWVFNMLALFDRIIFFIFLGSIILLAYLRSRTNIKEEAIIRKTLLDLSTKHTRLEIKELSERTGIENGTLKKVAKNMIKNQEIYARYFSSSRSVVFNQEANTEEIDKLMEKFLEWETEHIGKKL